MHMEHSNEVCTRQLIKTLYWNIQRSSRNIKEILLSQSLMLIFNYHFLLLYYFLITDFLNNIFVNCSIIEVNMEHSNNQTRPRMKMEYLSGSATAVNVF